MFRRVTVITASAVLAASAAYGAPENTEPARRGPQPIYKVTVISRTTKAVNYGYRSVPTRIGFQGTALMPHAEGEAKVASKGGSTLIEARVNDMDQPGRFGPQYLSYVLWAISPDGRPQNLGELILKGGDDAHLTATTNLQTFAMIVTAEPHFSVTKPSGVVVMENVLRSDTIGKVETVNASYELLPVTEYTYTAGAQTSAPRPEVSESEYEAVVALYQAQNAVQIAESQGAQRHAPARIAQARKLYDQARAYPSSVSKDIVALARESTQLAEDARLVSVRRAQEERDAREAQETAAARLQAESAQRAMEEQARRAREQAERAAAEAARAAQAAAQVNARAEEQQRARQDAVETQRARIEDVEARAKQNRARLVTELSRSLHTIDSPRGVVVTIREPLPSGAVLRSILRPVAAAIRQYPGVHLEVEAHTDAAGNTAWRQTQVHAAAVRDALLDLGVPAGSLSTRGYGNTRPTSAAGAQNRRVEIALKGGPIGDTAAWEYGYSVSPR
ncbi:MAG: OmpA family protein [Acidobacteria bacterium]|nr:OmpA family protein [Acidobacteriota bacterium]